MDNIKELKIRLCCICCMYYLGYGNNALPIRNGICCDDCFKRVLIARMNATFE